MCEGLLGVRGAALGSAGAGSPARWEPAVKFLAMPGHAGCEAGAPFKSRGMGVPRWLSSYGFPLSSWEWPGKGEWLEQWMGEGRWWVFFGGEKFFLSLSLPTLEQTRRSRWHLVSWQWQRLTHRQVGGMEEEEEEVWANARSLPQISVWGCRRLEPVVSIPPAPPRLAGGLGA